MQKKLLLPIIIILVILAGIGIGFAVKSQKEITDLKNKLLSQTKIGNAEVDQIVKEVGNLMVLPKDETPTIATITDVEKLKGQAFYEKAKNGDKVLIYMKAKKAILYDPIAKKIVDIAPVNLPSPTEEVQQNVSISPTSPSPTLSKTQSPTPTSSKSPTPTVKVQTDNLNIIILNGTQVFGLAGKFEPQVLKLLPNADVIKGNAKGNYTESLIIDISGKNTSTISTLSSSLKLKTTTLPNNETKPDTDIMIILGEDKSNL